MWRRLINSGTLGVKSHLKPRLFYQMLKNLGRPRPLKNCSHYLECWTFSVELFDVVGSSTVCFMIPWVEHSNPITTIGFNFTSDIKSDLRIWLMFLQGFNGDSYFTDSQWQDLNTFNFFTDSANSHDLRFGAYFQGSCFFSYVLLGGKIRKF